jgi:hypothetical protein
MAKSAVTTLALRILKSLQAAFLLQERDFTMESLCLSRSALESVYTWKYLASNPTRAQAWFGTTYHDAREFRFSEVVRATNSGEKPRRLYRLLCKFAHASGMTFWGGLEIRPTDYNMAQRMLCCEAILRITEQYIGEFMAIFGGKVFKDDAICRDVAAKCTQTAASLKTNYLREFLGAIDKVAKQLHQRIKPGRS